MDTDELEDYLELHDPKVRAAIAKGRAEHRAGKGQRADGLLKELRARAKRKIDRRRGGA